MRQNVQVDIQSSNRNKGCNSHLSGHEHGRIGGVQQRLRSISKRHQTQIDDRKRYSITRKQTSNRQATRHQTQIDESTSDDSDRSTNNRTNAYETTRELGVVDGVDRLDRDTHHCAAHAAACIVVRRRSSFVGRCWSSSFVVVIVMKTIHHKE